MTTYIALRELFSSNKTGLQGVASPPGNADSHDGDGECHLRPRLPATMPCQPCTRRENCFLRRSSQFVPRLHFLRSIQPREPEQPRVKTVGWSRPGFPKESVGA